MSARSANGDRLTMVLTNKSFATTKTTGSNSRSGGIPLLAGGYTNDSSGSVIFEDSPHLAVIRVGDIEVSGVIDQSTPVDVLGGWTWRTVRSVITGQVFKTGLNGFFGNQAAVTAAGVTRNANGLDAATRAAEIGADVEKTKILAEVELAQ